jgi:hypothetical protein
VRRRAGCWLLLALLLVALLFGWRELQRQMREEPERFPWTKLSLDDPVGPFTGVKLAAMGNEPGQCLALLREARLAETPFEQPVPEDSRCRFVDGVRIRPEDGGSISYAPQSLVTACPVAAALALWERDIVQPAAQRHFRTRVVRVDHAGSYSCRRLYGKAEGPFSQHATADAIDIIGFRLADGRQVSVLRDWGGDAAERAFLRDVRDGACTLFSTVLSPDYNRAHADHFHLDQANRGSLGWRLCR